MENYLLKYNLRFEDHKIAGWNQWTAYQGLRNKFTEYKFFTITGYENEANTIKENYIKSKGSNITLLWFHGNAGNITHRLNNIEMLKPLNLNIFIFDYRGYGKSKGEPNEEGIYLDSQAAYDWLVDIKKILPQNIILFGQ